MFSLFFYSFLFLFIVIIALIILFNYFHEVISIDETISDVIESERRSSGTPTISTISNKVYERLEEKNVILSSDSKTRKFLRKKIRQYLKKD